MAGYTAPNRTSRGMGRNMTQKFTRFDAADYLKTDVGCKNNPCQASAFPLRSAA
jgi:hypothetical protein